MRGALETSQATTVENDPEQDLTPKQVHLIRCAYDLISEKGVHRISLQEIADRAGTSKGIILYHFKTKDGLVLKTMEWVLWRVGVRIKNTISGEISPRGQVSLMIDTIFVGPDANRRFYLVYLDLLDHAARKSEFGRLAATFRLIVDAVYAEVIDRGVAEGVFQVADVTEAARTVRAIVDGLFLQWLQETDWKRLHGRYQERCERAVLTYLRVAETTAETT